MPKSRPLQRSNSADGGEPPSAAGFRSPGLSAAGPRLISGHPSLANRLRKCRWPSCPLSRWKIGCAAPSG